MISVVCTLLEGHYHHGLAALANSLYAHGFRGDIWAGYRGELPPWARAKADEDGVHRFDAAEALAIRFLKVNTNRHLTNYKPEFMTELLRDRCSEADRLFYFDPDIIVKSSWDFFERWADGGVALCEDVNSPMHSSHPLRLEWLRFFSEHGFESTRALDVYLNAGFVGVSKGDWEFISLWRRLMELTMPETNGLAELAVKDRGYLFHKPDQDGLNIAAMYYSRPLSIAGRDAMDFMPGGYLLSHALGSPKPWKKGFTRESLKGYPPSMADHCFMQATTFPIEIFSANVRRWKKLDLLLGCAIGRFYARR